MLVNPAVAVAALAFGASLPQAFGPTIAVSNVPRPAPGCTAEATKGLVEKFARNYSSGRVAVIVRLWAPEPRFQWFSTGPPGARLGGRAYDHATLAAYFRKRVRLHERIQIVQVAAGYDSARNIVHFAGKLVRSADDLRPTPPHDFKGAADCVSGKPSLIVWSM